jgi:hypothetical protein
MGKHHDRGWWQAAVSEWQDSDLSAEQFCLSLEVSPGSLFRWQHKLEHWPTDLADPDAAA